MFNRLFKTLIVSITMIFLSSSLFAVEEYISQIYKELDRIFIVKSDDELNSVLATNNSDKYYYLIENYTEKKIRRLIVNNDYDFAMTAIVIVIENNLDNEQAVEMYSVISDAYEVQQKHILELEHQRQLELARIEMEKEKQRGSAEKEFISAAKAEGGAVYVAGKEQKLSSSNWKASFGMVDLLYLMEKSSDLNTIHYGVSADLNYKYKLENKLTLGADLFAGFQFLGIASEENLVPIIGDVLGAGKFSLPFAQNFFVRAGFEGIITGKSNNATNTNAVLNTMFSPIVGIKLEKLPIGTTNVDLGADWLAGHLFYNNIKFAMGAEANVAIPFANLEKVKLSFNIGIKDKLFMKDIGIENRASLILAVGAENVVK